MGFPKSMVPDRQLNVFCPDLDLYVLCCFTALLCWFLGGYLFFSFFVTLWGTTLENMICPDLTCSSVKVNIDLYSRKPSNIQLIY